MRKVVGYVLLLAVAAGITACCWILTRPQAQAVFLGVGQGAATLLTDAKGTTILIDTGKAEAEVYRQLARFLPWHRRRIDLLLLSHLDADHVGGAVELLHRFSVSLVLLPETQAKNTQTAAALTQALEAFEKRGGKVLFARSTQVLSVGDFVVVLRWPDRQMRDAPSNATSIVAQVIHRPSGWCLLFSGDLPRELERYLVQRFGWTLKCQMLLAGHHGSRDSTDKLWLGVVAPEQVIMSYGENNAYGHPHQETKVRITAFDIPTASVTSTPLVIPLQAANEK